MRRLERVGDILLELERPLEKLAHDHDMQWGEILNVVRGWLEIHAPGQCETYLDGSRPEFYYGPKREGV